MTPVTGTSSGADAECFRGLNTQHDPWRASALAWRTGGDDNRFLGLQTGRSPFKLGDPPARALAATERLRASVRFRAVTGRPSRPLPRLGCARN